MSPRWLAALCLLGCAPTGAHEAEVEASPQVWPVPDSACPELPTGCTLEVGCARLLDDDALVALDRVAIDTAIVVVGEPDGNALRRLLELHDRERVRAYPEALRRDVTEDVAASRRRRAAIEQVLREHAADALDVALATGSADSLPMSLVEANDPLRATEAITRAIACGARGPDAQWVPVLAAVDHDAARDRLRELVRWPAASVQVAALASMQGSTDARDVIAARDAVASAWSPWVKRVARGDTSGLHRVREIDGVDCRGSLSWPIRVDRGGRIHELREVALEAELDGSLIPEAWANVGGTRVDLRTAAHVAAIVEGQWVFGVHRGEFGGGLFVREPDGTTRQIDPDPVVDLQPLGEELVVVSGTDHLGQHNGRVLRVTSGADARLVRRHRLELPAAPQALAIDDAGGLLIPTALGVVVIDKDDRVEVLGCDGTPR